MAYHDQLLEQARHLATRDVKGRPRQDHLRRAVSTAYYALFHFLVDQSCRMLVGGGGDLEAMRRTIGRAFDHGTMKEVSRGFASGTPKAELRPAVPPTGISDRVKQTADTFHALQVNRHIADYDLLEKFGRSEVLDLIGQADEAIRLFPKPAVDPSARLYLIALLAGGRVRQ